MLMPIENACLWDSEAVQEESRSVNRSREVVIEGATLKKTSCLSGKHKRLSFDRWTRESDECRVRRAIRRTLATVYGG